VKNPSEVVPPKNPQALAEGIIEILGLPLIEKSELGRQARRCIIEKYDIRKIIHQHEDLYETVSLNTSD